MSDWKNVCFECVDMKAEIRDLRIRIADCEGAIERREQFIAEANSERDAAKDAEVVAWGEVDTLTCQLEQAQAVATELAKVVDLFIASTVKAEKNGYGQDDTHHDDSWIDDLGAVLDYAQHKDLLPAPGGGQ